MGDKEDYLTSYREFFENFAATVNPEDQLPVNIAGYTITEAELPGEVLYWITQYLTEKLCPPTLITPLLRIILEEVCLASKKAPNDFGYKSEESVYIALRLMQAVTARVNEICMRYLDNSRLDSLPAPATRRDLKTVSCAVKNSRRVMEDRHVEIANLEALFGIETTEPTSFYAVYDGHAGSAAAMYCAAHLHQYLVESPHFTTDLRKAMKDAFIRTDADFVRKSNQERAVGGSTAVAVSVRGRRLLAAWAGDSLALLAKRMRLMQLVRPHKPNRQDERDRIESSGGTVMYWGTWRVNGQLAVSRAIGDAQYKPYVTARPEFAAVDLDGDEDFVVVACDGLWDFVSEDDVALAVYRQLAINPVSLGLMVSVLVKVESETLTCEQQKFGCGGEYEPPSKLQCGGGGGSEALTKFSVEIVQQLEFTTSAADSQPQQISTNVTVKALANAVKTSNSPPPPPQQQPPRVPTPLDCERECKAECKSEVADDEFVGLDECAAALERDAASAFPGLADLIGEDDGDDTFEDLITEISEYPEFMKNFDLNGGKLNGGLEGNDGDSGGRGFGGGEELSPAAQTLKHMAEQHQHQLAAGDWRYRSYYRPRAPPPPHHDHQLHIQQHQQVHLSQPHHNLQVSAAQAQHLQASVGGGGHVSVAAQQGMYANFQHQGAPSPHHHQGGGCDSYSMSQSQSINFAAMRSRPHAPPPPQQHQPSSSANPPQQPPLGVVAAGISREQQAKMLQQQQQQMLRAQHHMRPPPPDYKARFNGVGGPGGAMAPGGVAGAAPGGVGGVGARRPPPPRAFAPQRAYAPDWRHVLMQQQAARQQFPHHHQGFSMSQQQQQQLQQARLQQQQMMQHQQQRSNQQSPMSHLIMQQNQMMSVQGQMTNIHMSQSQNMSMQQPGMGGMPHQGSPMQNGPMQSGSMHPQNMHSSMMPQSQLQTQDTFPFASQNDFNLDFLDNMPSTDATNLTAQELLNSLDNSFLNDIL